MLPAWLQIPVNAAEQAMVQSWPSRACGRASQRATAAAAARARIVHRRSSMPRRTTGQVGNAFGFVMSCARSQPTTRWSMA
eukprot:823251-Lingulodinium_polyedra.AAC.1